MRHDPHFTRNTYPTIGKYEIPIVKKQEINLDGVKLIPCSNTKCDDLDINKSKGVHFFVDDYRFKDVYFHPEKTLPKYSQYAFVLTPDFSTYADMNLWRQIESVAMNRWCGAFWQENGLNVIPTVSWSTPRSYDFCFDGIENGSIVAVSTVGCKKYEKNFMSGYNEMLTRINPSTIICLGTPFPNMKGNIKFFEYTCRKDIDA